MSCKDCNYLWKEEDEPFMICHWVPVYPDDKAPCEYEEDNDA